MSYHYLLKFKCKSRGSLKVVAYVLIIQLLALLEDLNRDATEVVVYHTQQT